MNDHVRTDPLHRRALGWLLRALVPAAGCAACQGLLGVDFDDAHLAPSTSDASKPALPGNASVEDANDRTCAENQKSCLGRCVSLSDPAFACDCRACNMAVDGATDAEKDAPPACEGAGGLLDCAAGCPPALFVSPIERYDFSTATALTGWISPKLAPRVESAELLLGPHPMTVDWWENYTSAVSPTTPADVVLCAELRMQAERGTAEDDNSVSLAIRVPAEAPYETSGMTLMIQPSANAVSLVTRATTTVVHPARVRPTGAARRSNARCAAAVRPHSSNVRTS